MKEFRGVSLVHAELGDIARDGGVIQPLELKKQKIVPSQIAAIVYATVSDEEIVQGLAAVPERWLTFPVECGSLLQEHGAMQRRQQAVIEERRSRSDQRPAHTRSAHRRSSSNQGFVLR